MEGKVHASMLATLAAILLPGAPPMKIAEMLIAMSALTLSGGAAGAASLTTQDHIEIQQLYARYNHAIDAGNAEEWVDTFTPDGVFNNRFTGREVLLGFIKTWREQMNGANRRHWISNVSISGGGESAKGAAYLLLLEVGGKAPTVINSGLYADELVKTANGWRFKSRSVKLDVPLAPSSAGQPGPGAAPAKN
jgi:3-phenylpropionate/cinnamic acid dioxygenase small subunit